MREVLRADLTDQKAEMTITLTVNEYLVQRFEDKMVPAMAVFIEDFDIEPKSDYGKAIVTIYLC